MEEDAYLVQVAGQDRRLCARFRLLGRQDPWRQSAERFHSLWPIFKSRTLVENGLEAWRSRGIEESRDDYRVKCFAVGLNRADYAPRCFVEHQSDGRADPTQVPFDWPHMLSAIYQVRCNLFHGGKSFIYGTDQEFAALAFDILDPIWRPELLPKR